MNKKNTEYETKAWTGKLRDQIDNTFSLNEFIELCIDLDVDYDNLQGENKRGKIQSLIVYAIRRSILNNFLLLLKDYRPRVNWNEGGKLLLEDVSAYAMRPENSQSNDLQNNIRILSVEDDEDIQINIQKGFIRAKKEYQISFATTSSEAINLLDTNNFDVIILDLNIPNLAGQVSAQGGLEILNHVERFYVNKYRSKVLILTGSKQSKVVFRIGKMNWIPEENFLEKENVSMADIVFSIERIIANHL